MCCRYGFDAPVWVHADERQLLVQAVKAELKGSIQKGVEFVTKAG